MSECEWFGTIKWMLQTLVVIIIIIIIPTKNVEETNMEKLKGELKLIDLNLKTLASELIYAPG